MNLLCEHGQVNLKFALFLIFIISTKLNLNYPRVIQKLASNFCLWIGVSVKKYMRSGYEMIVI